MFYNMLHPHMAKYTNTDGTEAYSNGISAGKSMSGNVDLEYEDVPIYGDGVRVDPGKMLIGGKIKLGVTRLSMPAQALIGGHTYTAAGTDPVTPAKIVSKKEDKPNEVGYGFVAQERDEDKAVHTYALFYPRVQFVSPNASYKTKEKTSSYQTPTIEGDMLEPVSGEFEEKTEHETVAAALAYLKTKLSIA